MAVTEISGLYHVWSIVTDLARSQAFRQNVLGFEITAESPGSASDPAVRSDAA